MIKRPFEQWLHEDVEIEFGINRVKNLPALVDWLHNPSPKQLSPYHEQLRTDLLDNVELLNEDELKMLFIAPFLLTFRFYNLPHYRVFTQRQFSLHTPTVEANGKVEWFVATGKQTPKKPFFFLQEYKPEKHTGNDPVGQLLIAMVEAQQLNGNDALPIYGCYTLDRFWFFTVLVGKNYSISEAYDATKVEELKAMVAILEKVKIYIHQELGLPAPESMAF